MEPAEAIREGSLETRGPHHHDFPDYRAGLLRRFWAIDQPGGELLGPLAIVQFWCRRQPPSEPAIIPATAKLFSRWIASRRKELKATS